MHRSVAPHRQRQVGWQQLRRWHGPVAALFLLPAGFGFALFYLWPALRALYLSFTEYRLMRGEATWTGLDNYERLLDDPLFWHAMWVTLQYVGINIGVQTLLAMVMAVMMDRLSRSTILRTILVFPWIIPQVVVGMLWLWMLDPRLGIVNFLLEAAGGSGQSFFASPDQVVPTLALVNTWRFAGYTALLLFAGMQLIPRDLYEAAALDGAGEWRSFGYVTLPLMRPVLALVMVLSVVGSFQVFDLVHVATGGFGAQPGGPANASLVIYLYIFRWAFDFHNYGYASAMAVVLFGVLAVVTVLIMRGLRASHSDLA